MIPATPHKKFKYEEIIDHISDAIESGTISSGKKIPSIRQTANQFNCAISVVMQAYQELEIDNKIRGVEKSGYYALPQSNSSLPKPEDYAHSLISRPSKPHNLTAKIVTTGSDTSIIPLGCATPSLDILPEPKLKKHLTGLIKNRSSHLFSYAPPAGNRELLNMISSLMVSKGCIEPADNICITNGCTEALHLAICSTTNPGDTIAVESPAYFGLLTLLHQLGRKVLEIPATAETGMDISVLQERLSSTQVSSIIISPNFQNPLGSIMPVDARLNLLELAASYDIPIIEDDIYGECSFNNKIQAPLKALDRDKRVLYCSSFSKTVCPGLRMGWLIGGKYHSKCMEIKFATSLGEPDFLQQALAEFLHHGGYSYHIRKFRKRIGQQTFAVKELVEQEFTADLKITRPQGGYFLWVELPVKTDAMQLFHKALAAGIGIVPGPVFSTQENIFSNCMRLSCGYPVRENIKQAIKKLALLSETCIQ